MDENELLSRLVRESKIIAGMVEDLRSAAVLHPEGFQPAQVQMSLHLLRGHLEKANSLVSALESKARQT